MGIFPFPKDVTYRAERRAGMETGLWQTNRRNRMEKRKGITEEMTKQTRETSHEVLTERSEACAWPKENEGNARRARGTDGKADAYGAGRARDRLGM